MMSEWGTDEADEALRNVGKNLFQISSEECAQDDGPHGGETFGWIASNAGVIYGREYITTEPSYSEDSQEENIPNGSFIANLYETQFRGYLLMTVERNTTSGWIYVDTIVNDTSTIRNITSDYMELSSIWNATGWDTGKNQAGLYRIYAALTDSNDNALNSEYDYIEGWELFNITEANVQTNITNIRVYNITGNPNPKTYTGDMKGSGTNTTFTVYSDELYRIEIDMQNLAGSDLWYLEYSNITHENLENSWNVNESEIWYSNTSNRLDTNYIGGLWSSGNIKWNTSDNDGIVGADGNVTFYYIVNVSSTEDKDITVTFVVNDTDFTNIDVSTFNIYVPESIPPVLYQNIYNMSSENVIRGNSLDMYARWNESIGQAKAEYNSTSSALANYTITLPDPNPQNWTNYTISTSSPWVLGKHVAKIYAADGKSNWNETLEYINFTIWGLARAEEGELYLLQEVKCEASHCLPIRLYCTS